MLTQEKVHRFNEIQEQIESLIHEAFEIIPKDKTFMRERAKAYWYGSILSAIGDSDFLDLPETMQTTSDSLEEHVEDENEEMEEDEEEEDNIDNW